MALIMYRAQKEDPSGRIENIPKGRISIRYEEGLSTVTNMDRKQMLRDTSFTTKLPNE